MHRTEELDEWLFSDRLGCASGCCKALGRRRRASSGQRLISRVLHARGAPPSLQEAMLGRPAPSQRRPRNHRQARSPLAPGRDCRRDCSRARKCACPDHRTIQGTPRSIPHNHAAFRSASLRVDPLADEAQEHEILHSQPPVVAAMQRLSLCCYEALQTSVEEVLPLDRELKGAFSNAAVLIALRKY
jgi:hypothetical protein